jgi:hypothetical protein
MRIENFRSGQSGPNTRFSADLIWEDSTRPKDEVYFEVPSEYAGSLFPNPDAFLIGAIFPAIEAGEKRIASSEPISPTLRLGLTTVLHLFRFWYEKPDKIMAIDAKSSVEKIGGSAAPRAGAFFTGGVDSLVNVRRNRLFFPPDHPEWIKDLILLYGINVESDDSPDTFSQAVHELAAVAKDADVSLVPIYTNLRRNLNTDGSFFRLRFHGALLAAAAQALAGRITSAFIGSGHDLPNLIPWGSHPMVDPMLSTYGVRIYHDAAELTRFDKTKLIVDWEIGLNNLKVCPPNWPGKNCGKCEKCLRTILGLIALHAYERCQAFPFREISEEEIRNVQILNYNQSIPYTELIEPLKKANRPDLARAIEFALTKFRGETGFKGTLRRLDRVHLGGGIRQMKRSLQGTKDEWR